VKIGIEIDQCDVGNLINVLISEVGVLNDMLEGYGDDIERQNRLLTEKAEIIKMLGHQLKGAPKKRGRPKKVTGVTSPAKRGPGRPKGSKKGNKKGKST